MLAGDDQRVVDPLGHLERVGVADDLLRPAVRRDEHQRRRQVYRHLGGDRRVAVDLTQRDRELEHPAEVGRDGAELLQVLQEASVSFNEGGAASTACVRVSASIEIATGALSARAAAGAWPTPSASTTRADPITGTRPVYFPEFREFRATTVYDRYALLAGAAFDGPAIVEERESTLVVGPGGRFEVTPGGNIIVTIG